MNMQFPLFSICISCPMWLGSSYYQELESIILELVLWFALANGMKQKGVNIQVSNLDLERPYTIPPALLGSLASPLKDEISGGS